MESNVFDGILKLFLDNANCSLNDYCSHCKSIGYHTEQNYSFNAKFDNERSMASFMSHYFYSSIAKTNHYRINYINEFAVKMKSPVTKEKLEVIKRDHGLAHFNTPRDFLQFFYPDSFFHISCGENVFDIFIEYKITSKFILNKLAYDFLKYLVYTSGSISNSFFIYISLYKTIDGMVKVSPDDSTSNYPECYFLSDKNCVEELKKLNSPYGFFVYNGKKPSEIDDLGLARLDVLREINDTIEQSEDSITDEDVISAPDFFDDPFVNNISKFGENVITSERIKNNYSKILRIRKNISSSPESNIPLSSECKISFENFSEKVSIKDDKKLKQEIVDSTASYFSNQMKRILKNVKKNASLFNYSYKRANWILIIIAQFLVNNGNKGSNFGFEIKDFCDTKEDELEVKNILDTAYKNDHFKENINSLAFSLIYYITEVYPVIFDISDNTITMKQEYKAYKTKKTLVQLIHDFNRIKTGKKRSRKEEIEKIKVEEEMCNIAISILKEYAANNDSCIESFNATLD